MPRVRNSVATRKRRKKILKKARGYFGNKSRLYRYAKDAVIRSSIFSYRDRKKKKSHMRRMWITCINSFCREKYYISYSKFIDKLKKSKYCFINRKILFQMIREDTENDLILKIIKSKK
jgi:large subunit ribosomal protein L20